MNKQVYRFFDSSLTVPNKTTDKCLTRMYFFNLYLPDSQIAARSSANCPESDVEVSWIQYKDNCYAILMTLHNNSVFSNTHAQNVCQELGMYLHLKACFERYSF